MLISPCCPPTRCAVCSALKNAASSSWEPLPVLQGTLTLLADDGFTPEEALEWLYTLQDELGERPIDAMTSGRHHRVNRIASTLAF